MSQDLAIGNVIGRIETKEDGETVLYIMTLGILAPYRHQGLATRLLDHVKHAVQKHNEPAAQQNGTSAAASARPPPPRISKMYLHVQVTNESGKAFWEKRGFQVKASLPNLLCSQKLTFVHRKPSRATTKRLNPVTPGCWNAKYDCHLLLLS